MPRSKKTPASSSSSSNADWSRSAAYAELKSLGQRIGAEAGFTVPTLANAEGFRPAFLDRALDTTTQRLVTNTGIFGGRYRSTHDAQDELLSTASARHFISGLLNGKSRAEIPDALWADWTATVDLISRLRIPTRFSGYALSATDVMQHPTEVGEGVFSREAVFGHHGSLDSARVQYVGAAVKRAREAGNSVYEQFLTAARAAIEFSLNYFTAAVLAANVQPFSALAGVDLADPVLRAQLESRERIKDIYKTLGGTLRDAPLGETAQQSIVRPWQLGLPITTADPYPVAPPSPSRVWPEDVAEPEPEPEPELPLPTVGRKRERTDDGTTEAEYLPTDAKRMKLAQANSALSSASLLYEGSLWTNPDFWAPGVADSLAESYTYGASAVPSAPPLEEGSLWSGEYLSSTAPSAPLLSDGEFEPSAPFLSDSEFAPSAPPLSDDSEYDDFGYDYDYDYDYDYGYDYDYDYADYGLASAEPGSSSASNTLSDDDALVEDPTLNAFEIQSESYMGMSESAFNQMFPSVPTQDPNMADDGELNVEWPSIPEGAPGDAVGTESADAGADLLLLA